MGGAQVKNTGCAAAASNQPPALVEGGLARVRRGTGHSLAGRVIRIRRIREHELDEGRTVSVADFDGPARDGHREYWARWTLSLASLEPLAGALAPGMVLRPTRDPGAAGVMPKERRMVERARREGRR